MLIFYLCRNKPGVGAALFTAIYMGALWSGYPEDPLALMVGGHAVDWTIFALLALPLIFVRTHVDLKIPKWFFYGFYPAHLALIAILRLCLHV